MSASTIVPVTTGAADASTALAMKEARDARHAPHPEDPRSTARVAKDFEAVFIHQILQSSHALGMNDGTGYAGMALDALATGISEGGGLGLAQSIQRVLDQAQAAEKISPKGQ